ncbi:MAG: hypothetical protein AAF725_22280, partial [Acidobacteriota bacterium]
ALEKLGTIFGGYSEWGQPIHQVGNDVRLLGLAAKRPISTACFRMFCRHNRYVQRYGQVRDLDEISAREKTWWQLMDRLEEASGEPVGLMSAADFRKAVVENLDEETFELKTPGQVASASAQAADEPEQAAGPQPAADPQPA